MSRMFAVRLFLILLCAVPWQAITGNITSFTDETAWESASTNLTTIDFAGLGGSSTGANPAGDQGYPAGLTVDGVTFSSVVSGQGPYLFVRTASPNFLYGPPDGPVCYGNCDDAPVGSGIEVTLPADVTSISWDFANFYDSGSYGVNYTTGLEVEFDDGTTYTNNYTGSVPVFVGFTSTAPITSLEILGPGFPTVENFSFGQTSDTEIITGAAPTPEPASGLLAIGVSLVVIGQRRRLWLAARGPSSANL